MTLLAPVYLLLAGLSLPILALYMLKLRRREQRISSIMLWKMLTQDRQANTPWQRLRRNLLLFLQLSILAALVLTLARPGLDIAVPVFSGSVVVMLDGSASMMATDVSPNRFEAGKSLVADLVAGLDANGRMTIIQVGPQPQVIAADQQEKRLLRAALEQAQPSTGLADWEAAFALAMGLPLINKQPTRLVIISDGGLPSDALPLAPFPIDYFPVGQSADNLSITALAPRFGSRGEQLFVQATNFGDTDRTAILSIYTGETLIDAREITVPAGDHFNLTIDGLPSRREVYLARLTPISGMPGPVDSLSLDDQRYAISQPSQLRRALLATRGNFFLERLLAAMTDLQAYRSLAGPDDRLGSSTDPYDLYILDGMVHDPLPPGNLLLIDPPANSLFQVSGEMHPDQSHHLTNHKLTRHLDWTGIHISKSRVITLPSWADPLLVAGNDPLIFSGAEGTRRIGVVAFNLHDSDLPLNIAFPILFANLIDYLIPGQVIDSSRRLSPGEALPINPQPVGDAIQITSPSGERYTLQLEDAGSLFTATDEIGIYRVDFPGQENRETEYFAVNLNSAAESDIRPAHVLHAGEAQIAAARSQDSAHREIWPWLAAIALGILTLEWWIYHRDNRYPSNQIDGRATSSPVLGLGGLLKKWRAG